MKFVNLAAAVNAHYDNARAKFAGDLETLTAAAALDSWYYRDMMTPAAFKAAQALDGAALLPDAVKVKMLARFDRKNEKQRAAKLEKLATAAEYERPRSVSIGVEWHRSRVWGYNPAATVRAWHRATTGTASGCGYDKESSAIASAMNNNPEIMRILYEHAEKGGSFPYSVHVFAGVPVFDGGCGVSCFRSVFAACGYTWRDVASGKMFDAYTLEPAEVAENA